MGLASPAEALGESADTKVQSCYGACPGQSQHEIKDQLATTSMEVVEQRV